MEKVIRKMTEKMDFKNTIQDTVVAYFDLEFYFYKYERVQK